jgi:hypothetical protein
MVLIHIPRMALYRSWLRLLHHPQQSWLVRLLMLMNQLLMSLLPLGCHAAALPAQPITCTSIPPLNGVPHAHALLYAVASPLLCVFALFDQLLQVWLLAACLVLLYWSC